MVVTLFEEREVYFHLLATNDFPIWKDLLLRARVVARTSCMKILRPCLAGFVKNALYGVPHVQHVYFSSIIPASLSNHDEDGNKNVTNLHI